MIRKQFLRGLVATAALSIGMLGAAAFAADSSPAEREVTFQNGEVKLTGTILSPAGTGRHTGIVFVHGSGPGPRNGLRQLAEEMVRRDAVGLIFDKRGSGSSSGSWIDSSLDDLADDVRAAAAFLKTQPEIQGGAVGALGVSQGGWVIPRAAAREPDAFAFAIMVTGGGLRPIEVERHDYAAALEHMKATPDQKHAGMALVEQYFQYLKTGKERASLLQAIKESREQPWAKAVNIGRILPSEESQPKWAWVAEYDPATDIHQLRMPVLAMLGGRDRPTLSAEMNQRWRVPWMNHPDATVVEILSADHGMAEAGKHHIGEGPQSYVSGYLEILGAWLQAHTRH